MQCILILMIKTIAGWSFLPLELLACENTNQEGGIAVFKFGRPAGEVKLVRRHSAASS